MVQARLGISDSADSLSQSAAPRTTGLPSPLKQGVEQLSGISMDRVRVHYDSPRPARISALAYAQGTEIHLAPGQERHLPHEAWHVVQQAEGRVRPNRESGGLSINEDQLLEREADTMGSRADSGRSDCPQSSGPTLRPTGHPGNIVQRVLIGKQDITRNSPLSTVESTLAWSPFFGIQIKLETTVLRDLRDELEGINEFKEIVEFIKDRLEEGSTESTTDSDDSDEVDKSPENTSVRDFISEENDIRKKTAENFGWSKFPKKFDGLKKIGVHETTFENTERLVKEGPSAEKIDTEHHLGKGRGFYVTPIKKRQLWSVVRSTRYGESFLAVYVPSTMKEIRSTDSSKDNISQIDSEEEPCYLLTAGKGEIVIPERFFHLVKIVSCLQGLQELKKKGWSGSSTSSKK